MTPVQKVIYGLVLASAVVMAGWSTHRASSLQKQVKQEEITRNAESQPDEQLRQELARIGTKLAVARRENEELSGRLEEVAILREELARLQRTTRELAEAAQTRSSQSASVEIDSLPWMTRTKSLKRRFDERPGRRIPEMVLLKEQDWLEAARQNIEGEDDFRAAMSEVRSTAKNKFSTMIQEALDQFLEWNDGQFPTALSQLKPYLNLPEDSPIFDRYEVAKPGTVRSPLPGNVDLMKAETWAVLETAQLADPAFDMRIVIYQGGSFASGPARSPGGVSLPFP